MKRDRVFKILLFICLISIEYLATTTYEIKVVVYSWDKLNHFIAFFVLYILMTLAYRNMTIFFAILLLLLFAIQIEVVQYFIPHREFSLLDIVADFIGIVLGLFFLKFSSFKRFVYLQ